MGTVLLTVSGIISKILGFFYKVFLSRTIGASGLGLYQLIFPIFTLALAIAASGIQTAISRNVAIENAKGASGRIFLVLGLFVSTSLSLTLMLLIHGFAPWLATNVLMEPRAQNLLEIMSFSLIPASVHSCFNGYYYGKKESAVPSLCQISEQIARIVGTYIIYLVLSKQELPLLALHAVYGLVIGELAGFLVCLTTFLLQNTKGESSLIALTKDSGKRQSLSKSFESLPLYSLVAMALPLTVNHVLLNLSHSLENLLIPQQLVAFGYSAEEALSHFGVLSGMAMSVLMAPAVIPGSLSVLLLPRISEAKAKGDCNVILDTIKGAASCGIALGSLCTFLFLFSADWLGTVLFENSLAGFYIQILSILCPFLYTSGLLNSIVSGLGHPGLALLCNLSGCTIRIVAIIFFIPTYGMYAYIIAVIGSFVLTSFELMGVVGIKCKRMRNV